jgi:hypothetical protein
MMRRSKMIHAREDYNTGNKMEEIPEDEPVFLLRGQDKLAHTVVRYWCALAEEEGVDPQMIRLAKKHAEKMAAWSVKKTPDI